MLIHSPFWFLDIKFKEYSRSIQALKTEFSRSIFTASLLCLALCFEMFSLVKSNFQKALPHIKYILRDNHK